jgi:acyl carrier protein
MGLDAAELVMAVEEKFSISITDEEASEALTVGDLKRLVRAKLDVADVAGCLTQRAFHLIRKNATAEFGVLRHNLRPDTPLESVVPQSARRESWLHFQAALGVAQLPELVRPHAVNLTITVLVLSSLIVPVWYGSLHPQHFGRWMLFGAIVASAVGWGSAQLTGPMKTKFKAGYNNVRDLARFLVANYPQLVGKPRTAKWTEEEISSLLREVIIEQLGVTNFDDNSRFVQDLHID